MALAKKTVVLFQKINYSWKPIKKMTVAEWALENMVLSKGDTAEPGKFNFDRAPYQRGILEAVSDPKVEDVVMMFSAQTGKTTIDTCIIGYYIDYEPSPMMFVMPTEKLAKRFSKTRIKHMTEDVPCLKGKLSDPSKRDGENNTLEKIFPGGFLLLVGANSATDLSSTPVRVILFDEVDRMPKSVGEEGDPISLGKKRTKTFWNRKKILSSTPVTKGDSRIEDAFNESTQEEWNLRCEHCGEYQPPEFDYINKENATMTCIHCGTVGEEYEWKRSEGKWIATYPERKTRGFHLNEFSSPTTSWNQILEEYELAKNNPMMLKAWWNTALGLPYEETEEQADYNDIVYKREEYEAQIPNEVLCLTCGVDTQDDRLELEVVGWLEGEESYGIEKKVIRGDTSTDLPWDELSDYLGSSFYYEDGSAINISCTCIDSGGHRTSRVYDFCKAREHKRVFAIKGMDRQIGIPLIHRWIKTKKCGNTLFILGVNDGKETLHSRLQMNYKAGGTNDGYCHYPCGEQGEYIRGYDEEYFKGLFAEKFVKEVTKRGVKMSWKKINGVRNEPLDIRNYAQAAIKILHYSSSQWDALAKRRTMVKDRPNEPRKKKMKKRILSKGVS